MEILCCILCFFLFIFYSLATDDPCVVHSRLDGQVQRSTAFNMSADMNNDYVICDQRLVEGWYRVLSPAGEDLATNPAPVLTCGTMFPIWMNGDIPSEDDGIVARTACQTSLTDSCSSTLDIQVKNCGNYRVYNLKRANGCSHGYCFGDKYFPLIITTTTTTTTPATTTTEKSPEQDYPHDTGDKDSDTLKITALTVAVVVLSIVCCFLVALELRRYCVTKTFPDVKSGDA